MNTASLKVFLEKIAISELKEALENHPSTEKFAQDGSNETPKQTFSIEQLKSLSASKQVREYVRATLPEIGRGQGRAAYGMPGNQILKLALSDDKVYQNQNELQNAQCLGPKFAVKVLDHDPKFNWLIEERVDKVGTQAFVQKINQITGLENSHMKFSGPYDVKEYFTVLPKLILGITIDQSDYIERHNVLIKNSQWYQQFIAKMNGCHFASWDFHIHNWGVRPSTGELVLLDLGFTRESKSVESEWFKEEVQLQNNDVEPNTSSSNQEFNVQVLKTMPQKDVFNYLTNTLGKHIGRGAYRRVWKINDQKILKLAFDFEDEISEFSMNQNLNEVANAQCIGKEHAPIIYDYDPDGLWIIEEKLENISGTEVSDKLEELLGYRFKDWMQLKHFFFFAVTEYDPYEIFNDRREVLEMEKLLEKLMHINSWFTKLIKALQGCKVKSEDFHDENWGLRQSTGELVLLDLGF